MVNVCRCCGREVPNERRRLEIMVSQMRARAGTHATGPVAAIGCDDCGPAIVAGVLHVARLWTPSVPCAHLQTTLPGL